MSGLAKAARAITALFVLSAFAGTANGQPSRVIALEYDGRLTAVGFSSPIIHVAIGGKDARFLVDTGASVHVIANWFANAAGLTPKSNDTLHVDDASGHATALAMIHDVHLTLSDGGVVTLADAAVMNFPAVFEQNRIAGALSPQLLATQSQAAVLDLAKPELRIETMQSAIDRTHAKMLNVGTLTKVCGESATSLTHRIYAVRTVIAGIETSLVVDTGSPVTSLREGSPVSRAARGRSGKVHDEMDVTGHRARAAESAPVEIDFGAGPRKIPVWIGAIPTPCGSQGTLGMDALIGCRWVLGASAFAVTCAKSPTAHAR